MITNFLIEIFRINKSKQAIIYKDCGFLYSDLLDSIQKRTEQLSHDGIVKGNVVLLQSEPSPEAIATFLSLINIGCIVVPIVQIHESKESEIIEVAECEKIICLTNGNIEIIDLNRNSTIGHYLTLREAGNPGLVLFSSGTSGKTKAAVHDLSRLMVKYYKPGKDFRTLAFMFFDHIGGVDTLFYSLSNGSTIVYSSDRSPDAVCLAIQKHKIEVLPTTPTFLNLLLLSEAYTHYDLSSLKYITYGTEVMPDSTLKRISDIFPNVNILQKYGTTEVGTLRSKSRSSDSPWVKIGGEGFQTRVVDGQLQIKADSAMIGYINAPDPFTDDGWFITGDSVETDGEYLRILGRKSEIINVGGEKVYPAEVENVIQEIPGIAGVTVYGRKNPIMGFIVCALITMADPDADKKKISNEIKSLCRLKLDPYKVPVKIEFTDDSQYSQRYKKTRIIK